MLKYYFSKKIFFENLIELQNYNGYDLNRYYYDSTENILYLQTKRRYKIVKPFNNGLMDLISLIDTNGKYHTWSYHKLIRELNKIDG